jgi:pyruvate/2-oxoacid:ferredoxin oxidoreductase alpha subunit
MAPEPLKRLVAPYGATYDGAIDLDALRRAHVPAFRARATLNVDGNTAAAIPFLQWWRCPIVAGFPITPATKWLEHLAAESASGRFDVELSGRRVRTKRVKLLESEHAVADYLSGVASSCRGLITGTASSSVGLDHMAESLRSLGASGLGNVIVIDVCRATANYPLCIEGDASDLFAHRDDGFVQVVCRGKQQIYDALLQLPAVGMHPEVLTPTMPAYYGIKDSHRAGRLVVEPDDEVNAFLDEALALCSGTPPGLLDGDTAMGNCVTSAWFQGFKLGQKRRLQRAGAVLDEVARIFARRFGRPGLAPFELHGMDDAPEIAMVCMGPDAGTLLQLLPALRAEHKVRIGLVAVRLLTPFPSPALAAALASVAAVGVVSNAHHHGRGHLALDVADAVGGRVPVDSLFCGLGGADVSAITWRRMVDAVLQTAARGRSTRPWRFFHDGVELEDS